EALRRRLGDQLEEINRKKSDLVMLKSDRDEQLQIIRELEDRETNLRNRINELEREGVNLSHRLRQRERDFSDKVNELNSVRAATKTPGRKKAAAGPDTAGAGSSGDYSRDIEDLTSVLDAERRRADFLEDQARALIERIENSDRQNLDAMQELSSLRAAVAEREDRRDADGDKLTEAEARIAKAETQLNAILEQTGNAAEAGDAEKRQLLAEKLTLEEELERLRDKVGSVEQTILNEWNNDRIQQSHLRERLNDIAAEVSRLIYQVDADAPASTDESLFEKVRKFAGDSMDSAELGAPGVTTPRKGEVSERMVALRELRPS
ncbi:MAG TPA: hypothetical protein VMW31_04445, partial [Devosiaceae bacterium]|nr:hypothetical protein [Devosiaceae bacterium]